MKTASLSLALLIAASKKQSSTEARPGRKLDGKSSKANAKFPTTPESYGWIVGEYDPADLQLPVAADYDSYQWVYVEDGEPNAHPVGTYYHAKLEIKPLHDTTPSLVFQATFLHKFIGSDLEVREVMEGVGSFNPAKVDQVTFYSDHKERRNTADGAWTQFDYQKHAEKSTLQCSQVPGYPRGETIVCEYYGNTVFEIDSPDNLLDQVGISTSAWVSVQGEDV